MGGAHFKTHVKCVIATSTFYIGNALLSKYIFMGQAVRNVLICITWIFSVFMITKYAPADTEDVPILRKSERKLKKILSYLIMTIMLIASALIKENVYSNLFLFATLLQTIAITRPMYRLAKNRYGFNETYKEQLN